MAGTDRAMNERESLCDGRNAPLVRVEADRVVIDHGPFTTVEIQHSRFARWSDAQITEYHRNVEKWRRYGWLRWLGRPGRWMAGKTSVPLSKPQDRFLIISQSHFSVGA